VGRRAAWPACSSPSWRSSSALAVPTLNHPTTYYLDTRGPQRLGYERMNAVVDSLGVRLNMTPSNNEAQLTVDSIQVKVPWIEGSACPTKHRSMLRMQGIGLGHRELRIAMRPADILGRACILSRHAQRQQRPIEARLPDSFSHLRNAYIAFVEGTRRIGHFQFRSPARISAGSAS